MTATIVWVAEPDGAVPMPARFRLAPDVSAVRDARREVAARLHRLGATAPDVVATAVLLVSELAGNAVVHGRPPVEVSVERVDWSVRVGVADAGPTSRLAPEPADLAATRGRGLLLVSSLAAARGVDCRPVGPHGGGKEVWFELRLPGAAPRTVGA